MKSKRRLTDSEIKWVSDTMAKAPMGLKPSLRWFAHKLGVNQPSLVKSLGGWKGIERNRPEPTPKPEIIQPYAPDTNRVVKLQEYTTKLEEAV